MYTCQLLTEQFNIRFNGLFDATIFTTTNNANKKNFGCQMESAVYYLSPGHLISDNNTLIPDYCVFFFTIFQPQANWHHTHQYKHYRLDNLMTLSMYDCEYQQAKSAI